MTTITVNQSQVFYKPRLNFILQEIESLSDFAYNRHLRPSSLVNMGYRVIEYLEWCVLPEEAHRVGEEIIKALWDRRSFQVVVG